MFAALARALVLLVLPFFAVACPGSTPNPCAGVTCAPGRVCVWGSCKDAEQDDLFVPPFSDTGWQPSLDGRLDAQHADGAADGALIKVDGPVLPPKDDGPILAPDKGTPPKPDLGKPDTTAPGRWFQANLQVCSAFCTTQGRASALSPDGALCMSGENRSASGMAQGIAFTYGCWPNCAAATTVQDAASSGGFCYRPSQKKDGDTTDRTVGCFCR